MDEPELSREYYLFFLSIKLVDRNLEQLSLEDQQMHVELMKALPVGLIQLYRNSNDLDRLLTDINNICMRIFKNSIAKYFP